MEEAIAVTVASGNRQKLVDRRKEFSDKIAAIDEALALLDQNPQLERLADLLPFVLRNSDY